MRALKVESKDYDYLARDRDFLRDSLTRPIPNLTTSYLGSQVRDSGRTLEVKKPGKCMIALR